MKILLTIITTFILIVSPLLGQATTYSYDDLNRLKRVGYSNGVSIEYSYDAGGNILTIASSGHSGGGDSDGDGVPDDKDAFPSDPLEWADHDGDLLGDNADLDDDNDLLPDLWELDNHLNPLDKTDAKLDNDHDGLINVAEYKANTDPFNKDTDGDGVLDGTDDYPLDSTRSVYTVNYHISAGWSHSCALDNTGIVCWGSDRYAQSTVPALENPIKISAGSVNTCVLDDTGVVCWGRNDYGQNTIPVLSHPTQVSVGNNHVCAVDDAGVVCWGSDGDGQSTVPTLINPVHVSAGGYFTCAIDDTGVVCWGRNSSGQTNAPTLINPTQVSAGAYHTCALDDAGVVCWGANNSSRTIVPALTNPTQVSAGGFNSCALDETGVVCWGADTHGQSTVPTLNQPKQISIKGNYSCALDRIGVVCWGYNDRGQTTVPTLDFTHSGHSGGDSDGDGVPDDKDAFPTDPLEWANHDGDLLGDNADLDDDNDGIPDTWEIQYGLDPLDNTDAQADADSDSYSNLAEYQAGTNPNDSSDFPTSGDITAPIIKPELSTFHSRVAVTLHNDEGNTPIYYTTNGVTPSSHSTRYSEPFVVENNATVKAVAISDGQSGKTSPVTTKSYTVNGEIPWKPAPGATWQWQLQGTIDTSYNVSMYDIDLLETPQQTIDQLKADGRTVVCYFNAGAWEDWRNDANLFPESVKGNVLDDFSQEKWLDIREIDILAPLMRTRLDLAVTKGCDAVEPDNIDGYTNNSGFPLTAEDQIAYNIWLSNEANTRGLSIGLKNDLAQIPALEPFYDWALNERCFQQSECDALQPFIDANKAVFGVEYQGNMNTFCPDANTRQFSWLYKSIDLDAATDFCMDSTVGGVVSGLTGQNLALQNNGAETITINSNGSFSFTTSLAEGDAYTITVSRQPTQRNQTCTVANGNGSMLSTNVTNVQVSCVNTAFIGGDNDGNGKVNIQDIVSSINTILSGGAAVKGGDCNNDGEMNIQDIVCAINRVLSQ